MFLLLLVLVALGVILEVLSLRRDPETVGLEYSVSVQTAEPGSPFDVQITVTNRGFLPLSYIAITEMSPKTAQLPDCQVCYELQDGVNTKKVCRLSARQRKKLTTQVSVSKRGVHVFRAESIGFGDFLGIQEFLKNVYFRREVVVFPEKKACPRITDALGKFCGDLAAKRYLIRDPIMTVGSREYTGREPMKEIHWLQSARSGELMVREFDHTRHLSVSVILSVSGLVPSDRDGLDECCSIARAVCEKLIDTGNIIAFYTNSMLVGKASRGFWKCEASAGHKGVLLEGLGRVSVNAPCNLEQLLKHTNYTSDPEDAFILILPAGDRHGAGAASGFSRSTGREVFIIPVDTNL